MDENDLVRHFYSERESRVQGDRPKETKDEVLRTNLQSNGLNKVVHIHEAW